MSDLKPVGLSYTAQNFDKFVKQVNEANKTVDKFQANLDKTDGRKFERGLDSASQSASRFGSGLNKQLSGVTDVLEKLPGAAGQLGGAFRGASTGASSLGSSIGALSTGAVVATAAIAGVTVAIAAATAAFAGFLALGRRGASIEGIQASFESLTGESVLTSRSLRELRDVADGTISQQDLLIASNVALAGSTGEFRQNFQDALPTLLETARAAAQLRGIDPAQAFADLVEGIKKGEPEIIDNLGITLKVGEAYEQYAAVLGKNADQLTQQEQSQAILNATLAGSAALVDGVGGVIETNSVRLQRSNILIKDSLDTLALAAQPAFAEFLNFQNNVLSTLIPQIEGALIPVLTGLTGVLQGTFSFLGQVAGVIGQVFGLVLDPIQSLVRNVSLFNQALTIALTDLGVFAFLGDVFTAIGNGIVRAARAFGVLIGASNAAFDSLASSFVEGAANIIGAFVAGIIRSSALVTKVVADIAQIVADFLVGFSPPKRGALKNIDKGGENIISAWVGGMAGASLEPISRVSQFVANSLGSIASFSRDQVESRFAELDSALIPFQNRLDIVKSRFESISAPAEAAISSIDRQLNRALTALTQGDTQAARTIQLLDAQRAAIQANVDVQQDGLNRAQIQLALKQAEQAEERTLLNIRKAQLPVIEKIASASQAVASAASGGGGAKELKKKTGTGKASPVEAAALPGLDEVAGTAPSREDAIRRGNIPEGAGTGEMSNAQRVANLISDPIQEAGLEFQTQADRVRTETGRIGEGLTNVQTKLSAPFEAARDAIETTFGGVGTFIISQFDGITEFIAPIVDGIKNPFIGLAAFLTDSRTADGFAAKVSLFRAQFGVWLGDPLTLVSPFLTGLQTEFTRLADILVSPDFEGSFAQRLTAFFSPEDGVLATILQSGLIPFQMFYAALFGDEGIFAGVGDVIEGLIVTPVIGGLNNLIAGIEVGLQSIIDGINTVISNVNNATRLLPGFRAIEELGDVSLPRVQIPGAATGGTFTGGLLRVGEQGEELIAPAGRVSVFPNNVTQSLDRIAAALTSPVPVMQGGNTNNNSSVSNRNVNVNVTNNGVQGASGVQQRFDALRFGGAL